MFIACYSEDKLLRPVACLEAYEKATASFRVENQQLFLAVTSPHNAVTSSTIARWLSRSYQQMVSVQNSQPTPWEEHPPQLPLWMELLSVKWWSMQAGQARTHSASIISGLQNRPCWQLSSGHLYSNSLQTCRGHVDGTGTLQSTIGEWLRMLAAECCSWLYKEGEGEYQHVLLPTRSHPEKALSYGLLIMILLISINKLCIL